MRMIITGAASGIGRAVATLAAKSYGAQLRLLLVDRELVGLEETAHQVAAAGGSAIAMPADLSIIDTAAQIVRRAESELGGIDSIISNAGINRVAALKDLDVETYDLMFDVNTRPTWLLGKAAHPALSKSRGNIVATASISCDHPTPPLASYSASKAALVMLVRQMALEWGPDGIRCNCVSPGPTYTGMTKNAFNDENDPKQMENRRRREAIMPLRKLGQPEEVANAILFLAGPGASQITGVVLNVDGGLTLSLMPATGSGQGHVN